MDDFISVCNWYFVIRTFDLDVLKVTSWCRDV